MSSVRPGSYLEALESQRDRLDGAGRGKRDGNKAQKELPLFAAPAQPPPDPVRDALAALDPDELTPKAALETLYRLRKLLE